MRYLRNLLWTVYAALSVVLGVAGVLVCAPLPYRFRLEIARAWCRGMLVTGRWFAGLRLELEGLENLPDEPSVVLMKHSSLFETYAQAAILPRSTWVIKRELLWTPVFGWGVALLKPIAINRQAGSVAVKQVIEQGSARLAEGIWVTIFPEGTRMPPGTTRKYGVSGAALAQAAGCKIVPVAQNAADIWPRSGYPRRPGVVRMVIGPPIDAQGRPPKETNRIAQAWIEAKMREISSGYRKLEDSDPA